MTSLFDILDFLSVLLHGLVLLAQSLSIGGIMFLLCLAHPLARQLGPMGPPLAATCRRIIGISALCLAALQALLLSAKLALLTSSTGLTMIEAAGANFAIAGLIGIPAALAIGVVCFADRGPTLPWLLGFGLVAVLASTATSHAVARLEHRTFLLAAVALHQIAAATWIGGIPYFLIALHRADGPEAIRLVGRRFSRMAMGSVAALLAAGVALSLAYVDSLGAFYSTSYGVMVGTKILIFSALLLFGGMNFRIVEGLRRDPTTPVMRLRRFAEAELGIGVTVFLVAASITSLPPAVDLPFDRLTLAEITQRMAPRWPPTLTSPAQETTTNRSTAEILARSAGATRSAQPDAGDATLVPDTSDTPEDIAWSEFNHNWAGIIVLAIGLVALAERAGFRWGRNWPLLFIVLAVFLFFRNDPENWPLGPNGFFESFADPSTAQHRVFILLVVLFAGFEWGIRTKRITSPRAALVFPISTAVASALMLTHSHSFGNIKAELLIELTHIPLAVLGVAASWARWLEIRLPPDDRSLPSWLWPICFAFIGLILMFYRET